MTEPAPDLLGDLFAAASEYARTTEEHRRAWSALRRAPNEMQVEAYRALQDRLNETEDARSHASAAVLRAALRFGTEAGQ